MKIFFAWSGIAPRNMKLLRAYPLRSSAEPTLLFLIANRRNRYTKRSVIKDVQPIHVPYHYHYSPSFKLGDSNKLEWIKQIVTVWYLILRKGKINLMAYGNLEKTLDPKEYRLADRSNYKQFS